MKLAVALILLGPAMLSAEELPQSFVPAPKWQAVEVRVSKPRPSTWWKASVMAMAAATSIDAASSWGRLEMNPLLRNSDGRFGVQGVAVKALIAGGVVGAQYLMLRNHPKQEKYATVTNFVLSGALGAAAVSNIQRAK